VPADSLTLLNATLGGAKAFAFTTPTAITSLAPGASTTFTATFLISAVPGTSAPMSFGGTYSGGGLSGNWTVSFRSVKLP
jgi:hypothetical protein